MPFPSAVVNGGSRPGSAASQRSCNYKNGLTSSQTLDGTSWVIQKFGGTSVGKFPIQIVDNIVGAYAKHCRVAIVCSARSTDTKAEGTTNRLLHAADHALKKGSNQHVDVVNVIREDHISVSRKLIKDQFILEDLENKINQECDLLARFLGAAQIIDEISPRTKDSIIGAGEKLSCLFMASLLNDRGVPAQYVNLDNIIPIGYNTKNGIDQSFYDHIAAALGKKIEECEDKVPVITGYFGVVPGGLLEAIGRGYTDLCAALAAVGVNADELQVWKEVDGIFTADPRKVPTARLIPMITPDEAAELTYYGSEVIHPFTMEQVIRAHIPIRIKNVENPSGDGTVIFPDNISRKGDVTPPHPPTALERISSGFFHAKKKEPTAVTTKQNISVLNVHSNKRFHSHGFMAEIFGILHKHEIVVDLISTSEVHVSMALHSEMRDQDLYSAVEEIKRLGTVDVIRSMTIVSLVGKQMKQLVGIAGRMFSTLAEADINIEMISQGASEINISCVIQEKDSLKALNVLHQKLLCQPSVPDLLDSRPYLLN
ncbi:Aspartate/glutamate/uridylate kinase [Kockiozyma suomiensis]|uniref:Aspartate/glutamate/uridylate kinase n=1 Tax=Kockiozyma suomiensis TaxID=1337062 RepID=UPI003343DA3C